MSPRPPSFVAIGASGAEGLDDINSLLNLLRKPVQAIVMVVLHRPTDRVSYLQEVLARSCEMSVVVAENAAVMESGVCYIGQPTGHLTLMGIRLAHLVPAGDNRFQVKTVDFCRTASAPPPTSLERDVRYQVREIDCGLAVC